MQKSLTYLCLFLFVVLFTIGCSINKENVHETLNVKKEEKQPASDTVTLTISADASLRDAMTLIQREYHEQHPEVKIQFNYGGSGSLKKQILDGALTDLFISDSKEHFNELVSHEYIAREDTVNLFGNTLVLIAPKETSSLNSFEDLTSDKVETIAIGTPELVPAGQYAKNFLVQKGIWDSIQWKVTYGKDVRQVLSRVEAGEVAAGIVYKTDASHSKKVKMIPSADLETHSPIIYQAGILTESQYYEKAKEFFQYLQSEEALQIFKDHEFIVR